MNVFRSHVARLRFNLHICGNPIATTGFISYFVSDFAMDWNAFHGKLGTSLHRLAQPSTHWKL